MPDVTQGDQKWMARALELAIQGRGRVEPNPMVGCVIVKEGHIIGEGYHQQFGFPHAEPNTLAACMEPPVGATAYVTLEPCCHLDKKTPPCVPRLIEARLARVVVGALDPNPHVSGGGIEELRAAGIATDVLDLPAAKQLIAPFVATIVHRRPYVTLKWAQSADGKVAGPAGHRLWISNQKSRQIVHEMRARCDAILVGGNTVIADDPLLTVRDTTPLRDLRRVVLDGGLKIPLTSRLVRSADQGTVEIICSETTHHEKPQVVEALQKSGITVTAVPSSHQGRLDLPSVLHHLGKQNITHLLVESGPTLARGFFAANCVDRVWVFRSPKRIDDSTAPAAVPVNLPSTGAAACDGDELIEYLNPESDVFYALEQSAEFRLLARKDLGEPAKRQAGGTMAG